MVFEFLKGGGSGLEAVERTVDGMLSDCRHTFDVAFNALTTDADVTDLGEDVRGTDRRINAAEESARRALVVHVAVRGGEDVGLVMALLLMVKKLERVGDQNKNIFDLAEDGLRVTADPDFARLSEVRAEVSEMFGETARILREQDEQGAAAFYERATALRHQLDEEIRRGMRSQDPASQIVPRVLLWRYVVRIVANLASVATMVFEPIDRSEHLGDADETQD